MNNQTFKMAEKQTYQTPKHTNGNGNGNGKENFSYSTPDFFTTSLGVKIRFIGLNQQRLETLRGAGELPEVPYREYVTDFGGKQREPMDGKDFLDDNEKKIWEEYIAKRDKVLDQRDSNVMKYTFTSGFEIIGYTEEGLDEWKREQEEVWGLKVPGNRIDVKFQYINSDVIGNNDDFAEIMAGIMERTGVPAENLDELRATFRNQVRRNTPVETDGTERLEGEVGVETSVPSSGSNPLLEDMAP